MKLINIILLNVSGALIYMSILLPRIGLKNSTISRNSAAVLSGIGVGIGAGLSVYFGISNGDFIGSILTAAIAAFTAGLVFHFYNR